MTAILGLDAAWTEREPTGVALVESVVDCWQTICVAPSYDSFIGLSVGIPVDWSATRFEGGRPNIPELIAAARAMTRTELAVIAVDMPLSTSPFSTRRIADDRISSTFGGRGCSAHSPNQDRPGLLSMGLMEQFQETGFPLATATHKTQKCPCTIEVYPHPALLELLHRQYRVPYKVAKSNKYWPKRSKSIRIHRLLSEFKEIDAALSTHLVSTKFDLPVVDGDTTLSGLKRYEDVLDALVCAWVGITFLDGKADAYGDGDAAIWVPRQKQKQK